MAEPQIQYAQTEDGVSIAYAPLGSDIDPTPSESIISSRLSVHLGITDTNKP